MGSDSETGKSQVEEKRIVGLAPIAKPLAGKKLTKRVLKLVRRASENKCTKKEVKEVVRSTRRGHKGLCVIAGNIFPIDVITHIPILCEDSNISYIYVPSKEGWWAQDLAGAGATKPPNSCLLVMTKPVKGELDQEKQEKLLLDYNQEVAEIKELSSSLF